MITPWVLRIIIANVALFFAGNFLGGFERDLVLIPALIPIRPWTLVTYMFLHQGFSHIFFNMLSLFFFGPRLEAQLSGGRFVALYFLCGIVGGLLCWVFSPGVAIVGASGAVLGVMFGYAKYWPRDRIILFILPMEVRYAVLLFAGIDLYMGFRGGDGVAHFAHLGGALAAVVFLWLLDRSSRRQRFEAKLRTPRPSRSDLARWSRIRRDELHVVNREELDRIMEKIERLGIGSVTPQERVFLDNFSERHGG